jgi:hypothetical protein
LAPDLDLVPNLQTWAMPRGIAHFVCPPDPRHHPRRPFAAESAMRRSIALPLVLALAAWVSPAIADQPAAKSCQQSSAKTGAAADVAAAVDRLKPLLSKEQLAALERPFDHATAVHWSNLPILLVPRTTLRLGDLDAKQAAAARDVFAAALSACGLDLLDEIRLADDVLAIDDKRQIGWSGANYYMAVLGKPAAKTPWMLQVGGHHIAYNFTFNGRAAGATPLFFGTEPISYEVKGVKHEPLSAQSQAMSRLAASVAMHPESKLSGTFTDVVKGVFMGGGTPGKDFKGGTDTGFPHSYPTGETDRGIEVGALTKEQRQRVREAIESYASLPGQAISAPLLAAYLDADALNQTYVGISGSTDFSTKGSYVRIDGPRIWMEMVVQPAIAKPQDLHFHALWRDKQSDYGGEVGP